MFCDVFYPDGRAFERDTRSILKTAVAQAAAKGYEFAFGAEMEFYLFKIDELGQATTLPTTGLGIWTLSPTIRGSTSAGRYA